eukprot:768174-Hanusia_phi.AAC.9
MSPRSYHTCPFELMSRLARRAADCWHIPPPACVQLEGHDGISESHLLRKGPPDCHQVLERFKIHVFASYQN